MSKPLDLTRVASSLEGYGDDDTAWVAAGLVRALLAELKQARALLREARPLVAGACFSGVGTTTVSVRSNAVDLLARIDAALAGGGGE